MNKYELVYDLKEHLDTYSQTYDDYIMSYGEVDMIYHYIEEKDKEIERLNNIIENLDKMFGYYFLGNLKYDQDTVNTIYIKYVKLKELKGETNE